MSSENISNYRNSPPTSIWINRWESLRATINLTVEQLKKDENQPETAEELYFNELFTSLLNCLVEFGDNQYCYFYYGFDGDVDESVEILTCKKQVYQKLNTDLIYTSRFVLRQTFDQLSTDFGIIQKAIFTRKMGTCGEKTTLASADKFGQSVLPMDDYERVVGHISSKDCPAQEFDFDGEADTSKEVEPIMLKFDGLVKQAPFVVSYFSVVLTIRILPYANVVLVGIPHSAIVPDSGGKTNDMLFMGHELGHYVYRNGDIQDEPLSIKLPKLFRSRPPYINNWLEEIFCDVFGVISVADPALDEIGRGLVQDNSPLQQLADSGVHPIDAVRPFIYFAAEKILSKYTTEDEKQKDLIEAKHEEINFTEEYFKCLQTEYEQTRAGKSRPKRFLTTDEFGLQERLKIKSEVEPVLFEVIREIVELLYPYLTPTSGQGSRRSLLSEITDDSMVDKLKESLQIKLEGIDPESLLAIEHLGQRLGPQCGAVKKPFETLRDTTTFTRPIDPEIWKIVFHADGWIKDGPPAETHIGPNVESTATR